MGDGNRKLALEGGKIVSLCRTHYERMVMIVGLALFLVITYFLLITAY